MAPERDAPGTPVREGPLQQDLRAIFREGTAWSVMVGMGETYFAAFVLALGMGPVAAGLIATVPMLAGGLLQLITPWGVDRLRSRRRWVVLCAAVQAAAFLPLVVGAVAGRLPGWMVFGAAAIYWGAGLASGPAWNVWIGRLVPRRIRAGYFARRNWAIQVGSLVSLLAGGAVLEFAASHGQPLLGFAAAFAVAGAGRLVSARYLAAQSERRPPRGPEQRVRGRELLQRLRHGAEGRLLGYMVLLTAAVALSSPYFTPYMIRELEFSYTVYMVLIGASYAAKIATLAALGPLARRFGAAAVLKTGGAGIMLIPFLWLPFRDPAYLFALQVLSGAAWACFEFATFLLLFDTIREEERTSLLTTYNLANAAAAAGGSILGGLLFTAAGSGVAGYRVLFVISGVARLGALLLLVRVAAFGWAPVRMVFRTLTLRPSAGSIDRPLVAVRWMGRRAREVSSRPRASRTRGPGTR